jgi:hypothetical protein
MRSILFALTEPEDGDEHMVFVDGLLMSSGSEGYKLPPPAESVEELLWFLGRLILAPKMGGCLHVKPWFGLMGWHAAAQRMGNDTSPQNGSCRLTFGYRTRTI